jgi:hypothetical protein
MNSYGTTEVGAELNAHLGWRVSPSLILAVRGQNLLHAHHREYVVGQANDIPRSALLDRTPLALRQPFRI